MNNEIRVWDPLIRLFHWGLVLTFVVSYLTGEEESDLHIYAGYAVLGLIIFRVFWGFVGTRHARFNDFVTSPSSTLDYLKNLADKPKRYIGHNPAGGWMTIIMLVTLFIVTVTGLKVYAIEEGLGPLASDLPELTVIKTAYADDDDDDDREDEHDSENTSEEFWEEIHEGSSNLMLLLILLHLTGVFVSGRLHDENLAKAMITGRKRNNSG